MTRLADYRPPDFLIPEVELFFDLDAKRTLVKSRLRIEANPKAHLPAEGLFLDAKDLDLLSISINGKKLMDSDYALQEGGLFVPAVPKEPFFVEIANALSPKTNTALEGLYESGKILCTQNEAEGFRRITPFIDRPDVMSRYTVHLKADPEGYPVLLSNGNRISETRTKDGRLCVSWQDPFPKPCYLFALVAGNLEKITDEFVTQSGRKVCLEIYVDPGNGERAQFAMESLKKAMRWDEENFGLEYDLDLYMIVAVEDFNMGAMENKGLNLFNAKLVLASPKTATDDLFESIEGVIAHEYFHNWTGNRVTCRDWFQLTLKEGLTVYRDQRFTEDQTSPAVKRIKDVVHLRSLQFAEDAGPLAHPIQPDEYIEINNFYTLTVYEKGAEVVRMIATLIGKDAFRRGLAEYFRLYDGQAVTIDEFLYAMGRVSDLDVALFRRWYKTAGTPELLVEETFRETEGLYILKITQEIPVQKKKEKEGGPLPLLLPIRMGLLDEKGDSLSFSKNLSRTGLQVQKGEARLAFLSDTELRIDLASKSAEIHFQGLSQRPVLSFLRNFSAPVKYKLKRSPKDLALLFGKDPDPFARFDAGQSLMHHLIAELVDGFAKSQDFSFGKNGQESPGDEMWQGPVELLSKHPLAQSLLAAYREILSEQTGDLLYNSLCLRLPSLAEVTDRQSPPLFETSHAVLLSLRAYLARELRADFRAMFDFAKYELQNAFVPDLEHPEKAPKHRKNPAQTIEQANESDFRKIYNKKNVALRRMKNLCLRYLCSRADGDESPFALCYEEFLEATNLSEELSAFQILCDSKNPYRQKAIGHFKEKWSKESLVMDYYFSVQAAAPLPSTLERVRELKKDDCFRMDNPNKVRSLFGAFGRNALVFHRADGKGYECLAGAIIELNAINPSMAAGLARAFTKTHRLDAERQSLARKALQSVLELPTLKAEVYEIVQSCLKPNA